MVGVVAFKLPNRSAKLLLAAEERFLGIRNHRLSFHHPECLACSSRAINQEFVSGERRVMMTKVPPTVIVSCQVAEA
jgi:hypothetical protein